MHVAPIVPCELPYRSSKIQRRSWHAQVRGTDAGIHVRRCGKNWGASACVSMRQWQHEPPIQHSCPIQHVMSPLPYHELAALARAIQPSSKSAASLRQLPHLPQCVLHTGLIEPDAGSKAACKAPRCLQHIAPKVKGVISTAVSTSAHNTAAGLSLPGDQLCLCKVCTDWSSSGQGEQATCCALCCC